MCYVRDSLNYNNKGCISYKIGNIFIEILILKTKPITVGGVTYKLSDRLRFLDILSESLNRENILNAERYILEYLILDISKDCITFRRKDKNMIKDRDKIS